MRITTMEAGGGCIACGVVNGFSGVHANTRLGTAVFGGAAEALAIEAVPRSQDEKSHYYPHISILN